LFIILLVVNEVMRWKRKRRDSGSYYCAVNE
jgi:hypothetical protein